MIRSASRTRAASLGLMPMPTSPAYSAWRLSKVSWKRKPQPTGNCQFSAKRCSALAPSASQPLPPAISSGRCAASSIARRSRSAPGAGQASAGTARGSTGAAVSFSQHVLGQHQHHRARPALQRGVEGACHVFGQAVGVLHLAHPLGHAQRAGAEHLAVVDLLEGLAVALVAGHLADEQDHRRRVLERGVQPDAGVGGAGPARDEADARAAAQLALRLGHEGGAALLPAGDEADVVAVLVEAVEHGQIAFAGHAEGGVHALGDQGFDQCVAGGSCAHRRSSVRMRGIMRSRRRRVCAVQGY